MKCCVDTFPDMNGKGVLFSWKSIKLIRYFCYLMEEKEIVNLFFLTYAFCNKSCVTGTEAVAQTCKESALR